MWQKPGEIHLDILLTFLTLSLLALATQLTTLDPGDLDHLRLLFGDPSPPGPRDV